MDTTQETFQTNWPFLAGFWLIAAIPICLIILFPLSKILDLDNDVYTSPVLSVMFLVHFGTGYLWARSLSQRSGLPENRLMNISGGLNFALLVVGVIVLIRMFDPTFLKYIDLFKGKGNLEFGALFAPWIGLIAGNSGLALGLGLREWRLGLKMFGLGFASGFLIYLAIMFAMQLLGFKVGSGRAVMLPTTFLSMWSTALVGSALFGRMLAKTRSN